MSKVTIEFNMPEERDDLDTALKGWIYKTQFEDVWNKLFRPRHKHGYSDEKLNKLMESKNGRYVMEFLEEQYREIQREWEGF